MQCGVVSVQARNLYRLCLIVDDGAQGEVDVARLVKFTGVFAPLADPSYFRQVAINPDSGTICWPNGVDIAPDVPYSQATGQPLLVARESR